MRTDASHSYCAFSDTTLCADFTVDDSATIGLSLSENNQILKLDSSSPIARKFRVGDIIVQVNGKDCSSMSVSAMLENEAHVSLTALRRRTGSGVRSPGSDLGWAGH